MKFNLKIQNLGKLADAEIAINNFTIFAGRNNTGKTFASKMLYSSLRALNTPIFNAALEEPLQIAENAVQRLVRHFVYRDDETGLDAMGLVLSNKLNNVRHVKFAEGDGILLPRPSSGDQDHAKQRKDLAKEIRGLLSQFKKKMEAKKEKKRPHSFSDRYIKRLDESVEKIVKVLMDDWRGAFLSGFFSGLEKNLPRNFQILNPNELRCILDKPAKISIIGDDFGRFSIESDKIWMSKMEFDTRIFWTMREISRIVYLESPIYWKLRDFLESQRLGDPRIGEKITGVPEYFYDLAAQIRPKSTNPSEFVDLQERLIKTIGGKIDLNENGELFFEEAGKQIPLSLTAMGVTNIGFLAFLIGRNLIDSESFIFIDEPEAHLHPEWQMEMANALFALAKGGVTVVVATHSKEIIKAMEVIVKEDESAKEIVSFNHFVDGGVERYDGDFNKAVNQILEDLTEPFAGMYLETMGKKL